MVGTVAEVLVEGPSKTAQERGHEGPILQMTGRTECDRIAVFEGNTRQAGQVLPVAIYDAHPHTLFGTIVTHERGPEVYPLA